MCIAVQVVRCSPGVWASNWAEELGQQAVRKAEGAGPQGGGEGGCRAGQQAAGWLEPAGEEVRSAARGEVQVGGPSQQAPGVRFGDQVSRQGGVGHLLGRGGSG